MEKEPSYDLALFNVHPRIALLHSHTEFLFIVASLIGNRDNRCELGKHYDKFVGGSLAKKIKEMIIQYNIPMACERIMQFKMSSGRGLPWFLKK